MTHLILHGHNCKEFESALSEDVTKQGTTVRDKRIWKFSLIYTVSLFLTLIPILTSPYLSAITWSHFKSKLCKKWMSFALSGPVAIEKNIFKRCHHIFTISWLSPFERDINQFEFRLLKDVWQEVWLKLTQRFWRSQNCINNVIKFCFPVEAFMVWPNL